MAGVDTAWLVTGSGGLSVGGLSSGLAGKVFLQKVWSTMRFCGDAWAGQQAGEDRAPVVPLSLHWVYKMDTAGWET